MEKAIIGKKVGMSQIFDTDGKVIPVTVIEAGPCVVVQKKTVEKDGYEAVQLGYEDVPERKLTKPEKGHLAKAGVSPKKHLKEFQLKKAAEMNVGDIVKADTFAVGDHVDVTGISKGHGYAGVVKRHGAHTLKATHGSGPVARHAGSMGSGTDPSRIFKGKECRRHTGMEKQDRLSEKPSFLQFLRPLLFIIFPYHEVLCEREHSLLQIIRRKNGRTCISFCSFKYTPLERHCKEYRIQRQHRIHLLRHRRRRRRCRRIDSNGKILQVQRSFFSQDHKNHHRRRVQKQSSQTQRSVRKISPQNVSNQFYQIRRLRGPEYRHASKDRVSAEKAAADSHYKMRPDL